MKPSAIASLLILGTTPLFSSCCPDPCCPSPDPCAKCVQLWPECGPNKTITPNAGPCVSRGWDAHLTVDFIYWTAREDNLEFAYKESVQTLGNATTVTSKGRTFDPDWNFRPGFKIGFGILQDHDGWDVYANYTWFRGRSTKKTVTSDSPATERISPVGGVTAAGGLSSIEKMSANWDLDFNTVDLELGRNFFISKYLKLRPHFGLKGSWIDQDYTVDTTGSFDTMSSLGQSKNEIDTWGIGIRAGLDTAWHMTRCFSFLGDIAVSALWERFEVNGKASNAPSIVGANTPITLLNVENNFFTVKPVVELLIGFRWETWFCCDSYHFSLDAGWEIQWWSDQNQFFLSDLEARTGDLFTHGLTLRFRFDF